MREFYEQLDGNAVQQLIAESEPETTRLEFKTFGWFSGSYRDQAHKLIAKPLCALANTHGGVIVYGIKTRRGPEGIDIAEKLNSCPDPKKFLTTVSNIAAAVVQPPLIGVEASLIEISGESGLAAKVWVPESEIKPHMIESKDKPVARGHWYRNEEGCFRMGHVAIESAYRTRLLREMNSFPLISPAGGRTEPLLFRGSQVSCLISNKGNAPAIRISISFESNEGPEATQFDCGIHVGALGPGEVLQLTQNLHPPERKALEEFLFRKSDRYMVVAFRDLTGASYQVRLPLQTVATGSTGRELSFYGEIVVERDGRRLN